jgi:hypothetical protein
MLPGLCVAQTNQFLDPILLQPAGGRVSSLVTGMFQQPSRGTDILYINAATISGTTSSVHVGELLHQAGSGWADLGEDQINFTGVSNVVATVGDFFGTGTAYAFALTPTEPGAANLCLYGGTGAIAASGSSSFSGGNAYPHISGNSGCMTLPTQGSLPPKFGYIAALPLRTGSAAQLLLEDTANGYVYVLLLGNASASGGVLSGVTVESAIQLTPADGPGAISIGDLNGDGNTDFIVNGQTSSSATVYVGNGSGEFTAQTPYKFDGKVRSMLLYDMDGATDAHGNPIEDMVVDASGGANAAGQIDIWWGNGDGTFAPTPLVLTLGRDYSLAAAADMNGDGLPDLVLSDGSLVSILYNQGGRSFGTALANGELSGEQDFFAGQGINALSVADVNGDGAPDLVVANGGVKNSNAVGLNGSGRVSISLTANPPVINTGGIAVLLNAMAAKFSGNAPDSRTALAGVHPNQTGTIPTTTTLDLCVGPSAACPAIGYVSPPYTAIFTIVYGQIYNGITAVAPSGGGGGVTGTVVLYDDYMGVQTPICTLAATGGTCPPNVGTGTQVGTHVFTSLYSGDTTYAPSTSMPVTIVVTQDTTSAMLTGAPNPSPAGQPVTLTATLTGNDAPPASDGPAYDYVPPAGPVVFTYGSTVLGPGTLVASASGMSSTATLTTSALPVGTDVITATYAPTLDFGGASATFTETITPSIAGSFTLTVTPTPTSVGVGYSTLLTVTVTPQNGFSQSINLTCANLPSEASCFFDSATLANGGGTTSLVVGTTAPHGCGTTQPYFLGFNGGGGAAPFALPAVAGLLAMFLPGRRRWLRGLIALIVVAGATQMTGCGNCSDLGTRPATYTFQVTGTSAITNEVQSQAVTITVTI